MAAGLTARVARSTFKLGGLPCRWGAVLTCCVAAAARGGPEAAKPPAARTVEQVDEYHGVKVTDPYRWLESEEDPEVLAWVEAQNAYTRAQLDAVPERAAIKARLEKLYSAPTMSAPSVVKDRYFFSRREGLQNHSVTFVRDGSYTADPKVLLDPNTFSSDGTIALDWMSVSPKSTYVAYGKSASGDEKSTLYLKDVSTGEHLPDAIPNTRYCSIAWSKDEKSFLYTRYPGLGTVPSGEENYNRKVYHHVLGEPWSNDALIVGDLVKKEEMINPSTNATHEWVLLARSTDWSKNDLYLKPLGSEEPFKPVAVGLDAVVSGDIAYGKLFILTDHQAPRFRLMTADPAKPGSDQWRELIAQQEGVMKDFALVDQKLIVTFSENACSRIVIYDLSGKPIDEVKLPTLGTVNGVNGEWDHTDIFFSFTSFLYPPMIYRYDLRARELQALDKMEIDVDVSKFETKQVWFKSKDGTKVPMFIVHRKGVELNGRNPTLLNGYGGFNISLTPSFRAGLYVWLERGGVFALANIRGGGEFGREWHQNGRLGKKQNVFDDFLAAAEALIAEKYTNPSRLAISGGSNGGLLVGACLVQKPELFRAVLCSVPLLDMLRYHNFSIARLWIPEYGSVDDPEQFKWLSAYSPYQQVKPNTNYPAVLFMTGASDSRVEPLHAWKMAARMQAANPGGRPVLVRTETKAGHGAGKPLSKIIDTQTDEWSFLFRELGISAATN